MKAKKYLLFFMTGSSEDPSDVSFVMERIRAWWIRILFDCFSIRHLLSVNSLSVSNMTKCLLLCYFLLSEAEISMIHPVTSFSKRGAALSAISCTSA